MHRRHGRHDGRLWANHSDERGDFACMVHADFENTIGRVTRQAGKRQRHAPMIVVGSRRGMCQSRRGERLVHFGQAALAIAVAVAVSR